MFIHLLLLLNCPYFAGLIVIYMSVGTSQRQRSRICRPAVWRTLMSSGYRTQNPSQLSPLFTASRLVPITVDRRATYWVNNEF